MQQVLYKLRLKPGALPRFREYLSEFEKRRDECLESLRGEGVGMETFFLDENHVYVFKKAEDIGRMKAFQKSSGLPVYAVVKAMMEECVDAKEELMAVLDFSR